MSQKLHGRRDCDPIFLTKLIRFGKYKGRADTRSQRCMRRTCNHKPSPGCPYCKSLPFEPSNLRHELKQDLYPALVPYRRTFLEGFPRGYLMYANQVGQYRAGPRVATYTSYRALPLFRAKELVNRFTNKLKSLDPMSAYRQSTVI